MIRTEVKVITQGVGRHVFLGIIDYTSDDSEKRTSPPLGYSKDFTHSLSLELPDPT